MTNVFLLGFSFQLNTVVNWIVSTLKVHGTQFVFVMCSISGMYIYILYIYTYIDIYSIIFIDIHRYEIWITTVFNTYASQIQAIQIWLQTLQIASLHAVNICCWRIFHMTYIIHLEKKNGSLETAGKSYVIQLDVHHKGSNWDKTHGQVTIVTTQLLNHCCEAYKSSK